MMSEKKKLQVKFCRQMAAVLNDLLKKHEFGKALVAVPSDGDQDLFFESCAAIGLRAELFQMMEWFELTAKYSDVCDAAGLYASESDNK